MATTSEHEIAEAVMRIAAQTPNGIATFKLIYQEVPKLIRITGDDCAPSPTRNGEPMWHQIVRNIKSHCKTEGNAICEGWLQHVSKVGYKITDLGRQHIRFPT